MLEKIEKQASEAGYDNVEDFANAMLESQGQPTLEEMGYSSVRDYARDYAEVMILVNTNMKEAYSETEHYENSVNENGGFYIGRYEASYDNEKPASKISTAVDDSYGHTVTENGMLWNNILQTDALEKAKGMYGSSEFTSSLLTGSAWDRTLGWLEETGAVNSFEIVGDSKTWGNYSEGLQNTGSIPQTEKNHIFDLAGNLEEWTTEATSSDLRVFRGGYSSYTDSGHPCFTRISNSLDIIDSFIGFRLALYL